MQKCIQITLNRTFKAIIRVILHYLSHVCLNTLAQAKVSISTTQRAQFTALAPARRPSVFLHRPVLAGLFHARQNLLHLGELAPSAQRLQPRIGKHLEEPWAPVLLGIAQL